MSALDLVGPFVLGGLCVWFAYSLIFSIRETYRDRHNLPRSSPDYLDVIGHESRPFSPAAKRRLDTAIEREVCEGGLEVDTRSQHLIRRSS